MPNEPAAAALAAAAVASWCANQKVEEQASGYLSSVALGSCTWIKCRSRISIFLMTLFAPRAGRLPRKAGGQADEAGDRPPQKAQCAANEASAGVQGQQHVDLHRWCMHALPALQYLWASTSGQTRIIRTFDRSSFGGIQLLEGVANYEPGQQLQVSDIFKEGDLVDVAGTSIGKGFQGVHPPIAKLEAPRLPCTCMPQVTGVSFE